MGNKLEDYRAALRYWSDDPKHYISEANNTMGELMLRVFVAGIEYGREHPVENTNAKT